MRAAAPCEDRHGRLADLIARALGAASATIAAIEPLLGGAVHRHWRVTVTRDGGAPEALVLRAEGRTALGIGLDLAHEFALLQFLANAGLRVPPPIACCADPDVIGRTFHLTRQLPGSADPLRLVATGPHDALAAELAGELARLHRIVPPCGALAFLGPAPADPAAARLADYRRRLDAMGEARPAAEWGMRWLMRHAPPPQRTVLCHGDFRTGNYLVAGGRLVALMDWELAAWGDAHEDVAWLCSRCWRFGADACEAGGIARRVKFLRAYETAGCRLDSARLRYWEAMAALKWLVIALMQRNRFLRAGERSLDLALTGRRAAECEFELLRLTAEP